METLPTLGQNQNLEIKKQEVTVAKILWHINQIVSYPMSDHQIEDWARSLMELKPNTDLAALKFLIDKFKTGDMEYDYRKGIQNIFIGLRYVYQENGVYKISKDPVAVYIPRKEGTNNQEVIDEIQKLIKK